ncbi:MAG: DNA polymerase IV [Sarcina sp.]
MGRTILHVDMDAFFASVEILDNKNLRGKAVVVGGLSDRGVVTTCSYEARKYGVKSAMPIYMAESLCPELVIVPVRHYRYQEISGLIFNVFSEFVAKVEKVSIDEAYLDITDLNEDPIKFALKLKSEVKKRLGITMSVGISYNKFFAKIASEWNKPDGIMKIDKKNEKDIVGNLKIEKVHGLGEKSVEKLRAMGIFTVNDMLSLSKDFFKTSFGKMGEEIYLRIRGDDSREVISDYSRKSFGKENTFKNDICDKNVLNEYIRNYVRDIYNYLDKNNLKGKTLTVKIKSNDFIAHTKSKTYIDFLKNEKDIEVKALELLNTININKPLRLIGLTISTLEENLDEQIMLF